MTRQDVREFLQQVVSSRSREENRVVEKFIQIGLLLYKLSEKFNGKEYEEYLISRNE